ncbi:MAG: hypothetical protein KatS3mg119_1718 [Rhodothalassiaceae bacterium]|nr:MAG: hypothetical protein KatS3mg119_1718 [Rhodothalassiaceae bacterium]
MDSRKITAGFLAAGRKLRVAGLALAVALAGTAARAEEAGPGADFGWLKDRLSLFGSLHYRYEFVDQDGVARKANASTLRSRLGAKLALAHGLTFTVEGEDVLHLGPEHFNDTVNGRTAFPVVADPQDLVLNRVFGTWRAKDWLAVDAGRQAVNLDNQRFIGSVGWRQNDQTMDTAGLTLTPVEGVRVEARYVWRVNRIFGPDSPQGVWSNNDIVILNGRARLGEFGEFGAYGYLLDIPNAPAASSQTYGLRFKGKRNLVAAVELLYWLEYAHQSDYGANSARFGLDYWRAETGLAARGVSLKIGFERLEGRDGIAFQTPLATLHAQNGWADKFLTIPPAGLEDRYLDLLWRPRTQSWLKDLTARFVYHDFDADRGGATYGREYDALLHWRTPWKVTLTAKLARYEARSFSRDTTKFWLMLETAF